MNEKDFELRLHHEGHGHYRVNAWHKETLEEYKMKTTDSLLIDDAFHRDFDEDCSYYGSIREARQSIVDSLTKA